MSQTVIVRGRRMFIRPKFWNPTYVEFGGYLLPSYLKWRAFWAQHPDGRWERRTFTRPEKAVKWMDARKDCGIFFKLSCFAHPGNVKRKIKNMRKGKKARRRGGYKTADNLFQRSDFGIDFDFEDTSPAGKRKVFPKVVAAWEYLASFFGETNMYLNLTNRGWHILVGNFHERQEAPAWAKYPVHHVNARMVGNREYIAQLARERFTANMFNAGHTEFDYDVSTDTRRVLRVPGGIHQKSGEPIRWFSSPSAYADWRESEMRKSVSAQSPHDDPAVPKGVATDASLSNQGPEPTEVANLSSGGRFSGPDHTITG